MYCTHKEIAPDSYGQLPSTRVRVAMDMGVCNLLSSSLSELIFSATSRGLFDRRSTNERTLHCCGWLVALLGVFISSSLDSHVSAQSIHLAFDNNR